MYAQVSFQASDSAGCAPLPVSFLDNTPGAISWQWDFGNGGSSILQSPGLIYSNPGTYDVKLVVGFADGSFDSLTIANFIDVFASPVANLSASQTLTCIGQAVQFNNLTTTGTGSNLMANWDFGDGNTSSTFSPSHSYASPGTYTVILTVMDENGCSDFLVINDMITVLDAPDASFSLDNGFACAPPLTVQFTATDTSALTTHDWDFGDGNMSSQPNPVNTYMGLGTYTITHIVSLAQGCADTVVMPAGVSIGVQNPQINFSPMSICNGVPVSFDAGAGSGNTVVWDFGDGNGSNLPAPTHTYAAPGSFTVSVSITDANNCTTNGSISVNVGLSPTADFSTPDTLSCSAPYTVQFADNSVNAVGWFWDFGDGNTATTQNPSHTYTNSGLFDVSLTVISADSCTATLVRNAYVQIVPPVADFNRVPGNGCAPLGVQFTDQSTSPFGIVSWQWAFGDGGGSNLQSPTHVYNTAGSFDVELIVFDGAGCSDTLLLPALVQTGTLPTANFQADTTLVCLDQNIQFTNLSVGNVTCTWTFGDGGSSGQCDPVYVYADTGLYDVQLIVDENGCRDTLALQDYIFVSPPVISAFADQTTSCALPFAVQFSDSSFGANQWIWDFGNGDSASIPNPLYTYTTPGVFTASLIVSDSVSGCSDEQSFQISAFDTQVSFSALDSVGCAPFTVNFSSMFQFTTNLNWDFGDGNTGGGASPIHTYTEPGVYDVTLIALNNQGACTDTVVVPAMITVLGPSVDFLADPDSGCTPLNVQFTPIAASNACITGYSWDFGNGNSSLMAPSNVYTTGSYTVSLTVTDGDGCSATETKSNQILVTDPIAGFTSDFQVQCPGNIIDFSLQSSGVGLSYFWEFGDGNTSVQPSPNYAYANPGAYDVSLTITDINGCVDSLHLPAYITIAEFQADFVADTTSASCPPLLVNFTSDTTLFDITSWFWDFGDGATSIQPNPSHIYAVPDSYDVSLIMTTAQGCSDTIIIPDLIDLAGPFGQLSFTPMQGCPDLLVDFVVSATNTVLYQFDFDDGNLANVIDSTFSHTYTQSGTYIPRVILNDGLGCDVLIQAPDTVTVYPTPIAAFSANPPVVCDSGTVNFNDLTAGANVTSWKWFFGDGDSAMVQNPAHFYDVLGTYDITLIVESVDGCVDTLFIADAVNVANGPIADISVVDSTGCAPFDVIFTENTLPQGAPVNMWEWDFDDNNATANGNIVSHTFLTAGTYEVSMIAIDGNGCRDTAFQSIEVFGLPEVNFVVNPDSFGCAPFISLFQDLTPNAVDWLWDFGDNSPFSQMEDPNHIFTQDGNYTVSLTVTDVNGCVNQLVKNDYIRLDHPEADFFVDSPVCPGQNATFLDQSISDTSLVSWQWNFGDGSTGTGNPSSHAYASPGFYDINMIVEDFFGCADTILISDVIEVLISEVPQVPPIRYASVVNNNRVDIVWEPYTSPLNDFGSYVLYRSENNGPFQQIFTTDNIALTNFQDVTGDPLREQYCYRLQVRNYCGLGSDINTATEHCAMQLTAMALPEMIELNWTPYTGWDGGVGEYFVYRVQSYNLSTNVLIATLPGNTTTYIDRMMNCEEAFNYRIEAREAGGPELSRSDTARMAPIHARIQEEAHIVTATVENNSDISVEFALPTVPGLVEYVLEKDDGNGFEEIVREPYTNIVNPYVDTDVDVGAQSYAYRAYAIDTCGDPTPPGRFGQSIWLTATGNNGRVQLDWTPYQQWANGVAGYRIELLRESTGQYFTHATVNGGEISYLDEDGDIGQAINCYRIVAEEVNGTAISVSNEICLPLDPLLYSANAFSPNNDGRNDRFLLKGAFIDQFFFTVYNRWGQKVFESRDLNEGWDGMQNNGSPAPEGVYVYVADGLGVSGVRNRRMGTITLIR
ncbi:MAG: PKD domain-containing protein [Bacteroidota bacterium]